jgi:hypothetical protein
VQLKKDVCPEGDNSPSYYDGECDADEHDVVGDVPSNDGKNPAVLRDLDALTVRPYSALDVYQWAFVHGITTMPTFAEARMDDPITRAEMAKMLVIFASRGQ